MVNVFKNPITIGIIAMVLLIVATAVATYVFAGSSPWYDYGHWWAVYGEIIGGGALVAYYLGTVLIEGNGEN